MRFQGIPELTIACAGSFLALWRIFVVIQVFCVNSTFLVATVTDPALERNKLANALSVFLVILYFHFIH